eukprot:s2302_g2.t1
MVKRSMLRGRSKSQHLCQGLVVPGGSECVLAVRLPQPAPPGSNWLEVKADVMDLTGKAVLVATLRPPSLQALSKDPAVVLSPTSAQTVSNQELARCYASRGSDGEIGIDICKARCLVRALRRFSSNDLFLPTDQFAQRHLGPLPADVQEMCKVIGVKDLNELMEKAIPATVRRDQPMDLPDGQLGEAGSLALLKDMLSKNIVAKNFIGMGNLAQMCSNDLNAEWCYHGSHVPGPILRNLLENPGWYTAYTPNYQTLVCELTGMEVANASLLDEGTAAAEAMAMIARAVNSKAKNQFFISDSVHPQSIDCMKTRAKYFGMELVIGDHTTTDFASMDKLCGALVQYPDTRGRFNKFEGIADANGAYFIVAADPLSLVLAKPPSEIGADVVVGSMQRFGVPMWFGGPSAAYLATSKKQVRRMPGRLIGESLDRLGNPAYRLTLQTREQHIRCSEKNGHGASIGHLVHLVFPSKSGFWVFGYHYLLYELEIDLISWLWTWPRQCMVAIPSQARGFAWASTEASVVAKNWPECLTSPWRCVRPPFYRQPMQLCQLPALPGRHPQVLSSWKEAEVLRIGHKLDVNPRGCSTNHTAPSASHRKSSRSMSTAQAFRFGAMAGPQRRGDTRVASLKAMTSGSSSSFCL